MRNDLDHLPADKQRELARVVQIIFEEFEDGLALATQAWRKKGRIQKIILYGSYARGGWVDEPHTAKGYKSDYDLLIIVNDQRLTDRVKYWLGVDERLMREYGITATLKTPVNFIVHTLQEVNDGLAHVHAAETREDARRDLIERWDRDRIADPQASRIILTHTNDEVRSLNEAAREQLQRAGELGRDVSLTVERGARSFADGDRIMFLKNERSLGVKNGTLGTIDHVDKAHMRVSLDDGRQVGFDTKHYAHIDHGYAATIHKAQGMTVDKVHVLATSGLDRHASYVALSRHRETVDLHYGKDDFANQGKLVRTLERERGKDMASDYGRGPEAASLVQPQPEPQPPHQVQPQPPHQVQPQAEPPLQPKRSIFAGLKLNAAPLDRRPAMPSFDKAVQDYAKALQQEQAMRAQGYEPLIEQQQAAQRARDALDALRPQASQDLSAAFGKDRGLVHEAAAGHSGNAIRQMQVERDMRVAGQQRADRFIADWQSSDSQRQALSRSGDHSASGKVREAMAGMAKGLERDPQLESLLRNRTKELGLSFQSGQSLSQDLQRHLGRSLGRGLGL